MKKASISASTRGLRRQLSTVLLAGTAMTIVAAPAFAQEAEDEQSTEGVIIVSVIRALSQRLSTKNAMRIVSSKSSRQKISASCPIRILPRSLKISLASRSPETLVSGPEFKSVDPTITALKSMALVPSVPVQAAAASTSKTSMRRLSLRSKSSRRQQQ